MSSQTETPPRPDPPPAVVSSGAARDAVADDTPAHPPSADPFGAGDYARFEREDRTAGRVIGYLLCFFFVYTILVASAAIWWTLGSVGP